VLARGRTDPRRSDESGEAPIVVNRKAQKRAEALERQRGYAKRKPFADRLAKLDAEITALDAQRKAVEGWLASPDAYAESRKDELRERLAQQADLAWRLARLEAEWLEVAGILEKPELEA